MAVKKFSNMVASIALTMMVGVTGNAAANSVTLDMEVWKPNLTGESIVKTHGSRVNFKDDLDLKKNSLLNFTLNFKGEKEDLRSFYLKAEGAKYEGDSSLGHAIGFNGANYAAGDRVDTDLKMTHYQIGMRNEKVLQHGKFTTTYQLNRNSIKTEMADKSRSFKQSKDYSGVGFGVGFGWESLGNTRWFANITPLTIGKGGYSDYGFGVKTQLGAGKIITLGYKNEKIQAGDPDDKDGSKVELRGVYFGMNSAF